MQKKWEEEIEDKTSRLGRLHEEKEAMVSRLQVAEAELARRVGCIEELRRHVMEQSTGFEEDERRLREEIRRMDLQLQSTRLHNTRLQDALHSDQDDNAWHHLREAQAQLASANQEYQDAIREVASVRQEMEIKDFDMQSLLSTNQQLSEELEYFKSEFNRVEALLRVMELRAANMRTALGSSNTAPPASMRSSTAGRSPEENQSPADRKLVYSEQSMARRHRPGSDVSEKQRWIPPTGFQ
eukprot:evm.model.scf_232EXC.6 EVM.evm.TU.scf_232EXC.6   scf_232EXC:76822-79045(-)